MRKSITALAAAAASVGLLTATAPAQAAGPEQSFEEVDEVTRARHLALSEPAAAASVAALDTAVDLAMTTGRRAEAARLARLAVALTGSADPSLPGRRLRSAETHWALGMPDEALADLSDLDADTATQAPERARLLQARILADVSADSGEAAYAGLRGDPHLSVRGRAETLAALADLGPVDDTLAAELATAARDLDAHPQPGDGPVRTVVATALPTSPSSRRPRGGGPASRCGGEREPPGRGGPTSDGRHGPRRDSPPLDGAPPDRPRRLRAGPHAARRSARRGRVRADECCGGRARVRGRQLGAALRGEDRAVGPLDWRAVEPLDPPVLPGRATARVRSHGAWRAGGLEVAGDGVVPGVVGDDFAHARCRGWGRTRRRAQEGRAGGAGLVGEDLGVGQREWSSTAAWPQSSRSALALEARGRTCRSGGLARASRRRRGSCRSS